MKKSEPGHHEFKLQRRRNLRRITLRVMPDLSVRVSAPKFLSKRDIQQFVQSQELWIEEQRRKFKYSPAYPKVKRFEEGEEFLFLGQSYRLEIKASMNVKVEVSLEKDFVAKIPMSLSGNELEKALREAIHGFYRKSAEDFIPNRVALFSGASGLKPSKIRFGQPKTLWGSCSRKGNISLNWKMMQMPPQVIDYLIVHELCHIKEPNHSAKYWKLVESNFPTYREQEKWIKRNSGKLLL